MQGARFIQNDNMVSQLIRSTTALTTTFVSCLTVNVQGCNNLGLYFHFRKGQASGFAWRIAESIDKVNFHREAVLISTLKAGGTTLYQLNDSYMKLPATTLVKISRPLSNDARWAKVYVKALVTNASSMMKVVAVKSVIG